MALAKVPTFLEGILPTKSSDSDEVKNLLLGPEAIQEQVPDRVKKVYEAMSKAYSLEDNLESFRNALTEPKNRRKVYDALSRAYDVKDDFETFDKKLLESVPTVKPVEPPTVYQTEKLGETIEIPKRKEDLARLLVPAISPDKVSNIKPLPPLVYPIARVASRFENDYRAIGQALYGLLSKIPSPIQKWAKEAKAIFDEPGPITERAEATREMRRAEAYKLSPAFGMANDVAEAVLDLETLISEWKLLGLGRAPSLKTGELLKAPKLTTTLYKRIAQIGIHGALTTPGSLPERFRAAVFRVGYNITPFIATSVAEGIPAFLVDTMLNTMLTSSTYIEAMKKAKNPVEFLSVALPQFMLDVGMAWHTKDLPRLQQLNEWRKARRNFEKAHPDLALSREEAKELLNTFRENIHAVRRSPEGKAAVLEELRKLEEEGLRVEQEKTKLAGVEEKKAEPVMKHRGDISKLPKDIIDTIKEIGIRYEGFDKDTGYYFTLPEKDVGTTITIPPKRLSVPELKKQVAIGYVRFGRQDRADEILGLSRRAPTSAAVDKAIVEIRSTPREDELGVSYPYNLPEGVHRFRVETRGSGDRFTLVAIDKNGNEIYIPTVQGDLVNRIGVSKKMLERDFTPVGTVPEKGETEQQVLKSKELEKLRKNVPEEEKAEPIIKHRGDIEELPEDVASAVREMGIRYEGFDEDVGYYFTLPEEDVGTTITIPPKRLSVTELKRNAARSYIEFGREDRANEVLGIPEPSPLGQALKNIHQTRSAEWGRVEVLNEIAEEQAKVWEEARDEVARQLHGIGYNELDEFEREDVDRTARQLLGAIDTPSTPIEKADIEVFRESKGELKPSKNRGSLNARLFGLAKTKRIPTSAVYRAIEEGIGIKDVKFSGPGAITERQLSELIDRMRHVNPGWPDSYKEFYLVHGDLPLPDTGITGPVMLGKGGAVVNAATLFTKKLAQSVETALNKIGPVGRIINERVLDERYFRDKVAGAWEAYIKKAFDSLSDEEMREFIIRRESGNWDGASEKLLKANETIGEKFGATDQLAKVLGFKVRTTNPARPIKPYTGLGEKFWPHSFDYDPLKSEARRERLIKYWMKRKGLTRAEAERQMEYLVQERASRLSLHLEWEREFDVGGWLGDPHYPGFSKKKALLGLRKYILDSAGRIAEMIYFDEGGKRIFGDEWKTLAELIAEEPDHDKRRYISQMVKRIRGLDPASMERPFLSALRDIQVIRLLGLANIPNAFQVYTTVLPKVFTLGVRRGTEVFLTGIRDAIRNPDFAKEEVGAAMAQNIREVTGMSSRGKTGKAASYYLKLLGFSGEETFNNIVAASCGRPYIKEVFKLAKGEPAKNIFHRHHARLHNLALKELKTLLGERDAKEALERGELSDDNIAKASWRLARLTQFRGHPQDLPLWWTSDYGRTAAQFKTFGFNIVKLWWHHIGKPAAEYIKTAGKSGSLAPFFAFEITSTLTGEIIAFIRGKLLWGKDRPDNLLVRWLDDHIWAGTLGIVQDLFYAATGGSLAETVLGPSVGWLTELIEGLFGGKKLSTVARRQIPIIRSTKFSKSEEQVW